MFFGLFEDTVDDIVEEFVTAKDKLQKLNGNLTNKATRHLAIANHASSEAHRASKIDAQLDKLLGD